MSTAKFFCLFLFVIPCICLIECEYGDYTRNIGIPRAADGIYDSKNCLSCFAFECDICIYDNVNQNCTKVRVFGAGCELDLHIWCKDLWEKNSAKIYKNEAFYYSGSEGSVVSCLANNCATNDFEATFDPNNSNIAFMNFGLILFICILFE